MIKHYCLLAIILFTLPIFSQKKTKQFTVNYTYQQIVADGILDEGVWETADSAKDFWEYFPADSIKARMQTEIKMVYDDKNLYIGIKVHTAGNKYAIQSLKRDFRAGGNDNVTLLFDTYNDGTNAFLFGINPYGVRREGLVSGGGLDLSGFTTSWDVKWKGESKISENQYTSELIIPISAFKFKEGETKWRFNCYRFDTQSNESSSWTNIPQNQNIYGLTFMGDMNFERPLGKSRTPISLIPYLNLIENKDFENNESFTNLKVGGDAKIAIGNSMNLDITVNPDFSQVEVDDQITNLTRFEISLPEKRQFFVDNNDLFGGFGGSRDANPFFSRRIGIANDTAGNSIQNRLIGGIRLSGNLTKDWRLGLLNIQTDEDLENEIASNNNTVFAIQRKVFSRSNIGMFFINKQSFKDYEFLEEGEKYNRVVGIDYNLASSDNTWNGKLYTHKSFEPNSNGKDMSAGLNLGYNSRFFNAFFDGVYVGENFRSDLGFIRRNDVLKMVSLLERVYWPGSGAINTHGFKLFPIFILRPEMDFLNTDYEIMGEWEATFNSQAKFAFKLSHQFTFLTIDDQFEPTDKENALPLPNDTGYYYNSLGMEFRSDRRRTLSYQLESEMGEFFNGDRFSIAGALNLRFQPKALFSLNINYDRIALPQPYASADIWLLSPKLEITFSKTLFWSTLVQYSNQRDNLGLNSRLQWRFAPLSDLFIVYNDNYYVDFFQPRNRSINLKLTYWLNI